MSIFLTVLVFLPWCQAIISCRQACETCREDTAAREVLEIYCSMCHECLEQHRRGKFTYLKMTAEKLASSEIADYLKEQKQLETKPKSSKDSDYIENTEETDNENNNQTEKKTDKGKSKVINSKHDQNPPEKCIESRECQPDRGCCNGHKAIESRNCHHTHPQKKVVCHHRECVVPTKCTHEEVECECTQTEECELTQTEECEDSTTTTEPPTTTTTTATTTTTISTTTTTITTPASTTRRTKKTTKCITTKSKQVDCCKRRKPMPVGAYLFLAPCDIPCLSNGCLQSPDQCATDDQNPSSEKPAVLTTTAEIPKKANAETTKDYFYVYLGMPKDVIDKKSNV